MEMLYTIGHSTHKVDYFINLLKKYDINYLLDVRSTPYSKHAEQFNRENIRYALKNAGINYSFMGMYFGARQTERELYNEKGYLDFEKVAESEHFNAGMNNVIFGLKEGNRIALMCLEKDPIDCHRAIMVARAFDKNGVSVGHILADGSMQTQKELDIRLADRYFPDRAQLSIFNYKDDVSDEKYIAEAYRKRNEEIGYRLDNKAVAVG